MPLQNCIVVAALLVGLTSCGEAKQQVLLQKANSIPLPSGVVLLDSKAGVEDRHRNPRCWTQFVKRVYASDSLSFEDVLSWFEQNVSPAEWNEHVWRSPRAVQFISPDQIVLFVSDEHRFTVFPKIDVKEEERKHKSLFTISISQRADPALSTAACT